MPYDLKHITDFIFINKSEYENLSHEDKEKFFFIINRKFARKFPKHAKFLNKKSIDKSIALDIWYYFFVKQRINGIPEWYWFKQKTNKEKTFLKPEETDFFINFYDITEKDINFIEKNYPDELKEEVKIFKKFNKK